MSFALYCMLFGILVFCSETDGGNFTWNEPPPTQIVQAVRNPVEHLSSRQLFEGTINATLSWHFGLTELIFKSLLIFFEQNSVARVSPSVTGTPPSYANRFGLDWIRNQTLVKLFIFNVTTEDNGTFSCEVTADSSLDRFSEFKFTSSVQVDVVGPPSNIITSSNQTITSPAELTLNCSADGKPKPTITWRRVSDDTVVTMPLNITHGKNEESYRCTADNGVGNPLTKDVIVKILFSPKVTLAEKFFVGQGKTASLICQVEGNPKPTISWSPCDVPNFLCDTRYLNISKVQTAHVNYTCTARNALGIDSATTVLIIGGYNIYVRVSISGECSRKDSAWEALKKEFNRVFANTQSYSEAELIVASCGSLIFDVVLKFSTEVAEDETISTIQTAIVDGKLGELSVNVSSITGNPPVEQNTTAAPTSTTPKLDGSTSAPSTAEPTSTGSEGSAGPPWAIIGGVVGGVVVLAIVVGVLTWWVHKQRKCRKDTKIDISDRERQEQFHSRRCPLAVDSRVSGCRTRRRNDDRKNVSQAHTSAKRSGAYAQSGPTAANGTDGAADQEIEIAGAIPTYAVVYKSKKKKKLREVPPVYAEVDKSKKKTKKIDDKNLYETLDEPKKEKRPGELLYADLDDFQNRGMPTVSISPQPLPAIKKADPYERTNYADITQFLKGNATFPPNDGNGDTEMKPERPGKKKIEGKDKETPI